MWVFYVDNCYKITRLASKEAVADPGGGGGGRGGRAPPFPKKNEDLFLYNFVVKNLFCQYNIAIQNTDLGVLQKSSKHFLIYIFFQPLSFRTPPPSKNK